MFGDVLYSNVIYYAWFEDAKSSGLAHQAAWFHRTGKGHNILHIYFCCY